MAENSQLNSLINKLEIAALPVLHNTLQVLKAALEKPSFNYRHLDAILQYDPACMINLLAYANQEINKDFDKEISQVEHAAMFLGMERLEKFIGKITSIYTIKNKKIADKIISLQHRGVHAAFQAQNFAHLINDSLVNEIYTSTLVSPLSELVCWHLEPVKAQKVELLIHKDNKNHEQAQREIFGFSYRELAEALTQQWKIPSLFLQRQEMDNLEDASKAVKCMYLAEKCSIFAEKGWYYDAMYEHISQCANNFRYSEGRIARELHKSAVHMAHSCSEFFPLQAVSSYLALLPGEVPYTQVIDIEIRKAAPQQVQQVQQDTPADNAAHEVISQQPDKQLQKPVPTPEQARVASTRLINSANDLPGLIRISLNALYESKAFTRVAFIMLSKDKKYLQVRSIRGYQSKVFTESSIQMQPANLFSQLLAKPQSVLINQLNYQKFAPIINQPMKGILNVQEFIAKSIHVKGKPIGLFYMDKHPLKEEGSRQAEGSERAEGSELAEGSRQTMDVEDFNEMKKICALFDKQLQKIS